MQTNITYHLYRVVLARMIGVVQNVRTLHIIAFDMQSALDIANRVAHEIGKQDQATDASRFALVTMERLIQIDAFSSSLIIELQMANAKAALEVQ